MNKLDLMRISDKGTEVLHLRKKYGDVFVFVSNGTKYSLAVNTESLIMYLCKYGEYLKPDAGKYPARDYSLGGQPISDLHILYKSIGWYRDLKSIIGLI